MDFNIIKILNEIAQSPFFGCILLMMAVIVLFKFLMKCWSSLVAVVDRYNDTLIKVTVVMEKVLSHVEKD